MLLNVQAWSGTREVRAATEAAQVALARLQAEADEVLCLHEPAAFMAVGQWYEEFDQLTDEDVLDALRKV